MRRADRLFQVVNLIRVHQPVTAKDLAARLEVSIRTIYRYIDDLSIGGIPIHGEPGVGYAMHAGFELPPIALNTNELEILTLSLDMLSTSVGGKVQETAKALLAKIEAASPLSSRAKPQRQLFSMALTPQVTQRDCWEALHSAIKLKAAVQIAYTSLREKTSVRVVFPLGIFYWGGKWTTGAWCCTRHAYRDFRLDRITDVQAVCGSVSRDARANIADYMQHQASTWQETSFELTDRTLSVSS